VILGITAVVWAFMAWVGLPLMSMLYGIDFEPYRGLAYVMLVTGGVTAMIDFLYQVITVMRRQRDVTTLYCVTFGFSLFIPLLLVSFAGLDGAILSYLIVESILLVLLVWEYFRIRSDLNKMSKVTPAQPQDAE
jgi:O-antigen/teichoic acid export membrane protein